MGADLGVEIVTEAVESARSLPPCRSMLDAALQALHASAPSPLWAEIGKVDVDADVASIESAVAELIRLDDPPPDLNGYWFAGYELGDPGDPGGTTESVIALSGGVGFPDPDWLLHQKWRPSGYLPTPGLRSMAGMVNEYGDSAFSLVTYAVTFVYIVGLVIDLLAGPSAGHLLQGRDEVGIAAGFHDGDILRLGVLTSDGLDTATLGWC